MTSVVPISLLSTALRTPSGTLVVHAGAEDAPDVLPALLGRQAEHVRSRRLPDGPLRLPRLALLAREARRTRTPAVLVVHLTAGPRFARDAALLSRARGLGLHAVGHLVDEHLDDVLLREDCPVTTAALRSDVVVVADPLAATIVHRLLDGAPHAVAVVALHN